MPLKLLETIASFIEIGITMSQGASKTKNNHCGIVELFEDALVPAVFMHENIIVGVNDNIGCRALVEPLIRFDDTQVVFGRVTAEQNAFGRQPVLGVLDETQERLGDHRLGRHGRRAEGHRAGFHLMAASRIRFCTGG